MANIRPRSSHPHLVPAIAAIVIGSVASVFAQDPQTPSASSLFTSVRPEATIVVKRHKMGADQVEITMEDPEYPPDDLKARIATLGNELGSEVRGLTVGQYSLAPNNPRLTFLKAMFVVDGITRPNGESLRIQPILRAFAGSVKGLTLQFENISYHKWTVRTLTTDALEAEARVHTAPIPGIEYRVLLKTDDPAKIEFPDRLPERKEGVTPSETPREDREYLGWIALGVAGVAAGALVYLALVRRGRPGTPNRS